MKRIALYAISRNHSEFVDKWVNRAKGADGIFVLDLGSQDNTVAKLKKRGVTVGHYKGEHLRYDSARNQALEMVPKDYAVCVACELNDSLPIGWIIWLRIKMLFAFDLMSYTQRNHFNNQFVCDVNKKWIHKRNINFIWRNPVQEVFVPVNSDTIYKVMNSNLIVSHHEKRAAKKSDYFDLLKLGVQENPGNKHMIHYLAVEYMLRKDHETAINFFKQHIERNNNNPERAESMRYMAGLSGDYREKIQWLHKAITEDPLRKEHWMDLALVYYKIQDWEKVIDTCLNLMQIKDKLNYISYSLSRGTLVHELCAYAAYQLNRNKLAYKQRKMALKKNTKSKDFLQNVMLYNETAKKGDKLHNLSDMKDAHSGLLPEQLQLHTQQHNANYLKLLKHGEERLYCIIPFCHIILAPNGIKCCTWLIEKEGCNYVPLDGNKSLAEIWQDEALQRVRESIRDFSYTHCQLTYCPEVHGARQHLLPMREIKEKFPAIADFLEGRTNSFTTGPDFVNISNDLSCNLNCPSCCRHLLPDFNYKTKKHYLNALKTFGKSLKRIFLAGMGEPFFSPVYLNWIKHFRQDDFPVLEGITLNTNGQLLTKKLWAELPAEFKEKIDTVIVSIDGATATTYEKNRTGGTYQVLMENLTLLKQLRSGGKISILKLYYVYQLNNYKEIPEMIKIAKQFLFDVVFFARISNWGTFSSGLYKRLDIGNPGHILHGSLKKIRNWVEDFQQENAEPDIVFMT